MFIRLLSLVIAAQALSLSTALAGIVVTVQDAVISPNGTGTVDIYISSTDGTDTLSDFQLKLDITGNAINGSLAFSSDPDQSALDPSSDTNYVFYSNSLLYTAENELDGFNVPTGSLNVYDSHATFSFVTLSSPRVLGRIEFTHSSATPSESIGDQFSIVLSDVGTNTYFYDASGDPYSVSDISVTAGSVTVVPEPSGIAILVALTLFGGQRRSSRRRSQGH